MQLPRTQVPVEKVYNAHLLDGVTRDRTSEFAFARKDELEQVFQLDKGGYFDAVLKFVHTIATSESILIPSFRPLTDLTPRLIETLREKDVAVVSPWDTTLALDPEGETSLPQEIFRITAKIAADPEDLEALLGFLTREAYLVFSNPRPFGYNIEPLS